MKKFIFAVIIGAAGLVARGQVYVAGYEVAKEEILREIPEAYILKAQSELHVAYQHTSHGTHVSYGLYGLPYFKEGDQELFAVSNTLEPGKLELQDYAIEAYAEEGTSAADLSWYETAFIQATRNYLEDPLHAHINVVMWSWCDIAEHNVSENYLPGMDSLISEYGPGGSRVGTEEGMREIPVTFIFMTGHANKNANTGGLEPKNQAALINAHCNENGYFCLDYYSIDTHDMDDNYWEDAGDNGDSDSYGGNFYEDWQNSHLLGQDYFENRNWVDGPAIWGDHNTQHITANRKAFAMWWILARIAGWSGTAEEVQVTGIDVFAEGGIEEIDPDSSLQMVASVTPAEATDARVEWSVENLTGQATIDESGVLTAISTGTVRVVATAMDGSLVQGTLDISVSSPSGMLSKKDLTDVRIYPNPGNGIFYVEPGRLLIRGLNVVDANGSQVLSLHPSPVQQLLEIDLHGYPSGLYVLHLIFEEGSVVRQITNIN
jgi:hypothetical protein